MTVSELSIRLFELRPSPWLQRISESSFHRRAGLTTVVPLDSEVRSQNFRFCFHTGLRLYSFLRRLNSALRRTLPPGFGSHSPPLPTAAPMPYALCSDASGVIGGEPRRGRGDQRLKVALPTHSQSSGSQDMVGIAGVGHAGDEPGIGADLLGVVKPAEVSQLIV